VRRVLLPAGLALMALAPRAAEACAVCMAGLDDEARSAFLVSTLVMSVLPLGMVGGFVVWLRRRARQLESELEREATGARAEVSRRASSP
jgi:hypothetical protein